MSSWYVNGARSAFSLLEVMIASTILVVGLFGVLNCTTNLEMDRKEQSDEARASMVARLMAEKILNTPWGVIGTFQPTDTKTYGALTWQRRATPPPQVSAGNLVSYTETVENPDGTTSTVEKTKVVQVDTEVYDSFPIPNRFDPRPLTDRADNETSLKVDSAALGDSSLKIPRNLITLGVLTKPIGINKLEVYLEYYNISLLDQVTNYQVTKWKAGDSPKTAWNLAMGNPVTSARPMKDFPIIPGLLSTDVYTAENPTVFNISQFPEGRKGLIIRILVSWEPNVAPGSRRWIEHVITKKP